MAIVKHIKSNYSAAINYLLFEHDEKTGKKIVYFRHYLQELQSQLCMV
jgi:hypothetical protein